MLAHRFARCGLFLLTLFFLLSVLPLDASARAGGGKSFGSRGSRSYTAPRPAPAPTQQVAPSQGARPYSQPQPAVAPSAGGGFLRSMAGGIVGGMIGGMLFRSLGFAGGEGGAAGSGGGIGFMDIALIAALLYGLYWFMKRRRSPAPAEVSYRSAPTAEGMRSAPSMPISETEPRESDLSAGLRHVRQMDPRFDERAFADDCLDRFFQIQGAWANRDMSSIRGLLTDEMHRALQRDADELRAQRRINRLENIAVRSVEISEVWQEGGEDFITVRIYANLLDYTIDETSQQLLAGSRTEPVKFQEYWTFTRPVGENPWRLSAVQQAE